MGAAESIGSKPPRRRRPFSLASHIRAREVIIRSEVLDALVQFGVPDEEANKLAREALRRARRTISEILPDVTKQDLKAIKIRRSP